MIHRIYILIIFIICVNLLVLMIKTLKEVELFLTDFRSFEQKKVIFKQFNLVIKSCSLTLEKIYNVSMTNEWS